MILAGNKDDIRLVVLRAQEEAKQLTEIINRATASIHSPWVNASALSGVAWLLSDQSGQVLYHNREAFTLTNCQISENGVWHRHIALATYLSYFLINYRFKIQTINKNNKRVGFYGRKIDYDIKCLVTSIHLGTQLLK
ncbi:hypothetical protein YC2023_035740 [Brassica napus]